MDAATHKDIKFYFCTLLGAALLFTALFIPPVGVIEVSVLYGGASFLILAGIVEGADVKGILKEIRLLREQKKEIIQDQIKEEKDAEDR